MRIQTTIAFALLAACGRNEAAPQQNSPAVEDGTASAADPPSAANDVDPASAAGKAADPTSASACRTQDGKEIAANRLKAIGTEPFWAIATDGRCVTYSTPENQAGTRIWTAFSGSRESGQWAGFLGKDRFVLLTRPDPGCSDGMSDRSYPIAVTLTIGSEERRGCAAPE